MAEDHGHDEHGGGEGGEHKAHKSHGSHGGGHGGGHEEHAGAPEWLISFADNTALLMGFFVILLAMNMAPKKESGGRPGDGPGGAQETSDVITPDQAYKLELEAGIARAFNSMPKPDTKDPTKAKWLADWNKLQEQKARKRGPDGTSQKPIADDMHTEVRPNLTVEFDEGGAVLSQAARLEIRKVVSVDLAGKDWIINVLGHVSAGEAKAAERSERAARDVSTDEGMAAALSGSADGGSGAGYQLSYQRAYAVASEMVRCGIPWSRIRLVACADADRVVARVDNDPTKGRKNQRVQIIQSKDRVKPDYASVEPGGGR